MSKLVDVSIKSLVFAGQDVPALSDIELVVTHGEFVVISGPVASGKTALCHCLTGAVPHFFPAHMAGKVTVAGINLAEAVLPEMAGTVGYMMQDPQNQLFSTTIAEDVAFGPGNMALDRAEVSRRIDEALDFVGLSGFEDRSPETLSGGEAQRAVLAGVLAMKPKVLVLDQPAAEMDPPGRRDIYKRLGRLSRSGDCGIILVTDHPEELSEYGTRFILMHDGCIVQDSARPAPVMSGAAAGFSPGLLQVSGPGETAASLENCSYSYEGSLQGCRDVSLEIRIGEVAALVGLNGSGKTTLAKHFNGLVSPQQGVVRVLGRELNKNSIWDIRREVGFLFQNPDYQIFANSVEEEAAFALKIRKIPRDEVMQRVNRVLRFTGLFEYRSRHPQRLSSGQRQLLALASILAAEPKIIIADEPTSGLNRETAELIMQLLSQVAAEGGAVLLVTHDLGLAAQYAHRIVGMFKHQICIDIPTAQLSSHLEEFRSIGLDFGTGSSFAAGRILRTESNPGDVLEGGAAIGAV
ncbi:ABC transporter ATP-binding protein [Phosphitispora fastidiosa]|uniref:ABC transporter ATP-binding protein n=1 Tax=Phosphitispora fastidiosa TaxID=2837202 RepID=UPI001E3874D4|nr:energy-coupling factor transport system ATP-binding protein [Phosphitispora fastidiosa]